MYLAKDCQIQTNLKGAYTMESKRFNAIDIAIAVATLLLIGASIYLFMMFKQNDPNSNASEKINVDSISASVDTKQSNFEGIKITSEISNDENAPFAIQYPESTHTAFNDEVKKYIKDLKYDYLTEINLYKRIQEDFSSELNISFETFQHPNGLYSFIMKTNRTIGDLDSTLKFETFHLDHENGEMPTINHLLNDDQENLNTLSSLAEEALYADEVYSKSLSGESILMHTDAVWDNYKHFALTAEGLQIYFSQYNLKEKTPVITIPYEDVNEILVEQYQADGTLIDPENDPDDRQDENTSDVLTNGKSKKGLKRVALTFDDGPDPKTTERVLATLEKYDAKATFFMLGSRVEFYPEIAKLVQEAGHELGNHSWTHADLSKANREKINSEIHDTTKIIEEATGQKPVSFRPPYGAFNEVVQQELDIPLALWDVDTLDWKHRNTEQTLQIIKDQIQEDGSIILMHDIHPSTADGLDAIMKYLVDNDYTFVTVSELAE